MAIHSKHNYTRNTLLQMLLVFVLLVAVTIWQRDVIYEIYFANQVYAVGWAVNGGILLLFGCGLVELVKRFFEYRNQEESINRFKANVNNSEEPLVGIRRDHMVAERFLTLKALNRRKANINHNALAATLLASESSRNSFLKFVHNILILTGVFGTIVSLSISLLGASDMLQNSGQFGTILGSQNEGGSAGLGTMIYGMSTALSTTLTAIVAYLFFGYFYIKLTDTQTFLISKIEEVTATTLLPHLQLNQDAVIRDYSESIRLANELIQKLDQSQDKYADSAKALENAARGLSEKTSELADVTSKEQREMTELMRQAIEIQNEAATRSTATMDDVVRLLQRGFRLRSEDNDR